MSFRNTSRTYSKVTSGPFSKKKVLNTRPRVPLSQDTFANLSLPLTWSRACTSTSQHFSFDLARVPCVTAPGYNHAPDLAEAWLAVVKARAFARAFPSR